jgi:hypothetical protein
VPLEEDRRRGAVEFQPPLPPLPSQPAGARGLAAPPDPPAGQLEALVRSWSVRESEVADTTARHESRRPGFGPRLRIDSRQGSRLPNPVSDAYHAPRASADDDLAAFGDTLGRVLVAELQRYGIEVDEG